MVTALLSGGSGTRLWPLSNSLRSKQYIKILRDGQKEDSYCSMLQRVWQQLADAGFAKNRIITAGNSQLEIIRNQLGDARVAIEPERRDTFPAVVLSCCYAADVLGADPEEPIVFLPVDPYTDASYFRTLGELGKTLDETGADVVLMGAKPQYPDPKFGYIVPDGERSASGMPKVERFVEKPDTETAEKLIGQGALWNCGVFCIRIGAMLEMARKFTGSDRYRDVYVHYDRLPRISFDYQVLEKSRNLYMVPFDGLWKDLGTWDTLTGQMDRDSIGNAYLKDCKNTHVINELELPLAAVGMENAVIVASYDGILVADREHCRGIKDIASEIGVRPRYEERRWGTLKTLEETESPDGFTLLRKICFFDGMSSSYHFHNQRIEVMTVLTGTAEMIVDGVQMTLQQGSTITIPFGHKHALRAIHNFSYLETHIGKSIGDDDINRITFDWDKIPRT